MITIEFDADAAIGLFRNLVDKLGPKVVVRALDDTSRKIVTLVKKKASSSGLGQVTARQTGRWKWETYGRIPRAVSASKLFKKGRFSQGDYGRKIFVARSPKRVFTDRAPHGNIVIPGYKQWIPKGRGQRGKGAIRRSNLNPVKAPRSLFEGVKFNAQEMFVKSLENEIRKEVDSRNGVPKKTRQRRNQNT